MGRFNPRHSANNDRRSLLSLRLGIGASNNEVETNGKKAIDGYTGIASFPVALFVLFLFLFFIIIFPSL